MSILSLLAFASLPLATSQEAPATAGRPNVVVILADDLAYGDLALSGNPWIETPGLDGMARRGVRVDPFYVSAHGARTRAALLTGRPAEVHGMRRDGDDLPGQAVTLAELLSGAGYTTGIFGKWHLGHHAPHRPRDQGFATSMVTRGDVPGRLADEPRFGGYTDVAFELSRPDEAAEVRTYPGQATDVVFDECLTWIDAVRGDGRFFAWLAPHAPRRPHDDVPGGFHRSLTKSLADQVESERLDELARAYALVKHLDKNVGQFFKRLRELGLYENTLVVLLSDNGLGDERFSAGLRGERGSVYEAAIRAPFLAHWPARFPSGRAVERMGMDVDLVPTVLEACGVDPAGDLELAGVSLLPLLERRDGAARDWAKRQFVFRGARGGVALRSRRYKLVAPGPAEGEDARRPLELYDMLEDAGESRDLSDEQAGSVDVLRAELDALSAELETDEAARPAPILLGSPEENPVLLTRTNLQRILPAVLEGERRGRIDDSWDVVVEEAGELDLELRFPAFAYDVKAFVLFSAGRGKRNVSAKVKVERGATSAVLSGLRVPKGTYGLTCVVGPNESETRPVWQVVVTRR